MIPASLDISGQHNINDVMSKESGKLNQHIVPQAHIRRFSGPDGKIFVHRIEKDGNIKVYRTDPKNVSAEYNYYDDADPYDERSIESFLRGQEKRGQSAVDKLIESKAGFEENRRIVKYVSMLLGRTIPLAYENMGGDRSVPFSLTDNDPQYIRQSAIFESLQKPLLLDIDDMHCTTIRKEGGHPFLTGDVPVTMMSLDLEKDRKLLEEIGPIPPLPPGPDDTEGNAKALRMIEKLKEIMGNTVVLCPLSPDVCTIMYHRSVTDIESKLKRILIGDPVTAINRMMIGSMRCVYANRPSGDYILSLRCADNPVPPNPGVPPTVGNTSEAVEVPPVLHSTLMEIRFDRLETDDDRMEALVRETSGAVGNYRRVQVRAPDGSPATMHCIDSEDGLIHVTASIRHLAVFGNFRDWKHFDSVAISVMKEFFKRTGIATLSRVGFRTSFVMKPSKVLNGGPLKHLTPGYAEIFRTPPSTTNMGRVVRELSHDAWIRIRVIVDTPRLPDSEIGLRVDVDTYTESPISADRLEPVYEELKRVSFMTLRGATNPGIHKRMGIKG